MSLLRIFFLMFTLGFITCSQFLLADDRLTVPSTEEQEPVSEIIREVYGGQYEAITSNTARVEFIQEMFETAKGPTDSTEKYVLLRVARDAAIQNCCADLAVEIIDAMTEVFELERREMRLAALTSITQNARYTYQAKQAAEHLTPMIQAMIDADELETAQQALTVLDTAARKASDRNLLVEYRRLKEQVDQLAPAFAQLTEMLSVLESASDDPEANQVVGEYYCFLKNDWTKGLPHLAKSSDPTLSELAQIDLNASEYNDWLNDSGDRWWAYAQTVEEPIQSAAKKRAALIYLQIVDNATGLAKVRYTHRIAESGLDETDSTIGHPLAIEPSHTEEVDCSVWGDLNKMVIHRILRSNTTRDITVAFSPDSNLIALGAVGRVFTHEVANEQLSQTYAGRANCSNCVVFSPDGTRIIAGSGVGDQVIRIWDVESAQLLNTLHGHKRGKITDIDFSPNGMLIVSCADDRTVRLWNSETGEAIGVLEGHVAHVRGVAFSPDSNYVVSCSNDKTACIWNVRTGQPIRVLRGHSDAVPAIAFSPDGSYVTSGSRDKTVCIWDVRSGRPVHVMEGHTEEVVAVVYSPDGKYIASGSRDMTIRLWDASTGQQLRVITGHEGDVLSLDFSQDGKHLASGSSDCTLRIWEVVEQ